MRGGQRCQGANGARGGDVVTRCCVRAAARRELETDTVQVVYRRESEGYGVLIPKRRE